MIGAFLLKDREIDEKIAELQQTKAEIAEVSEQAEPAIKKLASIIAKFPESEGDILDSIQQEKVRAKIKPPVFSEGDKVRLKSDPSNIYTVSQIKQQGFGWRYILADPNAGFPGHAIGTFPARKIFLVEEPTEESTDQSAGGLTAQSTEQSTDQQTETAPEQSTDQQTEAAPEQSTDQQTEAATEQSTEASTEETTKTSEESIDAGFKIGDRVWHPHRGRGVGKVIGYDNSGADVKIIVAWEYGKGGSYLADRLKLVETSTEASREESTETATEVLTEVATDQSTEQQTEAVTDQPTEQQTETATDESTDQSTEASTGESTEQQTEAVTDQPTEQQTETATDESTDQSTEVSTGELTEQQTEAVTDQPTEQQTEAATEESTEQQTEESTGGPILSFGGVDSTKVLTGEKQVTRREYSDDYAQKFINAHKRGATIQAYTKAPYAGGRKFADLRLSAVYTEGLGNMTEEELLLEGVDCQTVDEFIDRYFKGDKTKTVWVIRFEVASVTEGLTQEEEEEEPTDLTEYEGFKMGDRVSCKWKKGSIGKVTSFVNHERGTKVKVILEGEKQPGSYWPDGLALLPNSIIYRVWDTIEEARLGSADLFEIEGELLRFGIGNFERDYRVRFDLKRKTYQVSEALFDRMFCPHLKTIVESFGFAFNGSIKDAVEEKLEPERRQGYIRGDGIKLKTTHHSHQNLIDGNLPVLGSYKIEVWKELLEQLQPYTEERLKSKKYSTKRSIRDRIISLYRELETRPWTGDIVAAIKSPWKSYIYRGEILEVDASGQARLRYHMRNVLSAKEEIVPITALVRVASADEDTSEVSDTYEQRELFADVS